MVNPVVPALIGLGGGVAIGYVVGSTLNSYEGVRPRIETSKVTFVAGESYLLNFVNFPKNTQLVGPISLGPPAQIANIGVTDYLGNVHIQTNAPTVTGTYYIIVWDAPTGKYCAMCTIFVT